MMARKVTSDTENRQRAYWQQEIEKAKKRFKNFWTAGDGTVDAYRLQKADGNEAVAKDKYNILFSSTETIRPNLYAQRPAVRVKLRNRDTASVEARMAARLLEGSLEYVIEEEDFDELMENAVEDLLLPGLGTGWVRYEAQFENVLNDQGEPILGEDQQPQQKLLDEMVKLDYVYWQDWLCGISRGWKSVPWVARRLWLSKEDATKRFGKEKAAMLTYASRESGGREADTSSETAEAWEIWDKRSRTAIWFAESYANDLLDSKPDPLRLKNFFPCPRPLRAISNTRTFVPRALYSQYKSQAETLNVMTRRIRLLGEALRVVGIYDGSQAKLADVLNPASGNRMIPVDNWAMFAQNGGIKNSIEWLPIEQVIQTLVQLQQAREIAKNEIYEITGFSDIVRGVSKASETLGAQNIKANWASARVKKMQKEVQRFARDLIAIAGEIIAEHCDPATIAVFSGVSIPDPQTVQTDPNAQAQVQMFQKAADIIRNEGRRVATVDIETDSTIMADEESERKDRMDFLGAAGAFLQQAVPAMEATPELGPLLGAMLMFTVRTFPSSRPIEEEFEKVQKVLEAKGAQPQQGDKDGHAAKAQSAQQVAQIKASTDQSRIQADTQVRTQAEQMKFQVEQSRLQQESVAEENRHNEAMAALSIKQQELALREREIALKEAELHIAQQDADTRKAAQETQEYAATHNAMMQEAGHEQEYERMEQEETREAENEGLTGDGD